MSRVLRPRAWALLFVASAPLLVGCQPKPVIDEAPAETAAPEEGDTSSMDARIKAALANLSPEDRAAAEKQKICPVSDEPLGSMDTPVKITVGERELFICCESCKDLVDAEPEKYLSKLER